MRYGFNYIIKSKENLDIEINRVFQKTYLMLSVTILFSAITSLVSAKNNFSGINFFVFFGIFISLLYLINFFKNNNVLGIILVFAFTGFLGYMLGPVINNLLSIKNGKESLILALILSGSIFLILSIYVLISKKNFEFLNGFLFIASLVIFMCIIINFFIKIQILSLTISGLVTIFSSLMILLEVSKIINGGETNYIMATVSLYLQIYNLFLSLLNIILYFVNGKND